MNTTRPSPSGWTGAATLAVAAILAVSASAAQTTTTEGLAPPARLRAVPFSHVQITDRFWAPIRATNRIAAIPVNLDNLEKAGNLGNFRLAARHATGGYQGPVFMDSDVYKALEAASYVLATDPDPALAARVDDIIRLLAAAQQPDGYLNTYYTVKEPGRRWVNLRDNHELYCAGHLFEAAVAHFQATGQTNLLQVARRYADCIDSVFGPPPKRAGYPGHPEIELALVKLWRATGERRYFELARFFVQNRGSHFFADEHRTPADRYDGSYWQDDVPICDHRNIKGHAVRAAYLLSGATDVAGETGDPALLAMIHRVWRNTTERNLYVTGGIGPSSHNEGFTEDYDLPNLTAYQETCASVALAQWNHRLALLHADARYADVVERALYNGVLAGMSHDGSRFFYVNPLASTGRHHRSPWFGCACCPPNVARTVAAVGGYAYALAPDDSAVYVNLYIEGRARLRLAGGQDAWLNVTTDYPWDGRVRFQWQFDAPRLSVGFHARVPDWCRQVRWQVNGKEQPVPAALEHGYLGVTLDWKSGDTIDLEFSMEPQRVAANPRVAEDRGRVALQRGPIVYCLEGADQSLPLSRLYLPDDATVTATRQPNLLGGMVVLKAEGRLAPETSWRRRLYQPAPPAQTAGLTAIPYYAWDNREPGPMEVWIPVGAPPPVAGGPERSAAVSLSFTSDNCAPSAIQDGLEPKGSREHPGALCHWWPHKGGSEWVQYAWSEPRMVDGSSVYWFDDTGSGECRLPVSWDLEYLEDGGWKPVVTRDAYPVALDQWCATSFDPVTTTALRLRVREQDRWAVGIHEWRVREVDE